LRSKDLLVRGHRARKYRSTCRRWVWRFRFMHPRAFSTEDVAISGMEGHACLQPRRRELKLCWQVPLHIDGVGVGFKGFEMIPCMSGDQYFTSYGHCSTAMNTCCLRCKWNQFGSFSVRLSQKFVSMLYFKNIPVESQSHLKICEILTGKFIFSAAFNCDSPTI
jgi:hypothetical protein